MWSPVPGILSLSVFRDITQEQGAMTMAVSTGWKTGKLSAITLLAASPEKKRKTVEANIGILSILLASNSGPDYKN